MAEITPAYITTKGILEGKLPQLEVGVDPDKLVIDRKGLQRAEGQATVWDDIIFPFTSTRIGANAKPDFDETNMGLLFPQNSTSEKVYIIAQMPHRWKEGSAIHPHVHWQQMNTNAVVWSMDYKMFNLGDTVPADFATITAPHATASVKPYASGSMQQLTSFPAIDCTGKTISSMLLIKLYRNDNVDAGAGTGDALAFQFDIHYEIDSQGSDTLYTK